MLFLCSQKLFFCGLAWLERGVRKKTTQSLRLENTVFYLHREVREIEKGPQANPFLLVLFFPAGPADLFPIFMSLFI